MSAVGPLSNCDSAITDAMITVVHLCLSLAGAMVACVLWTLVPILVQPYISSLRSLPGPPNPSWLYGNLKEVDENWSLHEAWIQKYGPAIKYKGFLSLDRLYTLDTRALSHVLVNSFVYQKPDMIRYNLTRIFGKGLLVVEAERHRQQRRIMNPAFGPAQVRELTEVFVEKAIQLRDVWNAEMIQKGGRVRLDVLDELSKMTLDVIGLAGFNYRFNALDEKGTTNILHHAIEVMFQSLGEFSVVSVLQGIFPVLRKLPDLRTQSMVDAQNAMRHIGMQLVAEKKTAIRQASQDNEKGDGKALQGRDLLTLLIKANMATDLQEDQRLSDEDVLAQIPTFLMAGHETGSNATTWCLYALAKAPEAQRKLREELWSVPTENPTMDELMALPYLDSVIRETLRVYPPIPATIRVAMRDDVIPLDTPFADTYGQVHDNIRISKGDSVMIPIADINRSKALWGEDASEFKPERWDAVPEAVQSIPGVWGNLLTFLGGPHACIGYRFSLVEVKTLIFTLIRAFEFELAVPTEDIIQKSAIVQRPVVRTELDKGSQMPLFITPHRRF
ncbi:hypothetical protein AcV7_004723 [Taiwanofungus camphoratus]|nr:hypothetical protein AcV7_004723 [Antrodia cinnamomea]